MKHLLIVDDHAVVRHGLQAACQIHGYEVISSVATISQARSAMAALKPDAVIVDINLPDGSGFDLILWIRNIDKNLPIIILTLNDSANFIDAARRCRANAYVVKSAPVEEVIAALEYSISTPHSFISKLSGTTLGSSLTAREFDVLSLIEDGLSNLEISKQLHISVATVKSHVSSILQKLNVGNRVGAIKAARDKGLLV